MRKIEEKYAQNFSKPKIYGIKCSANHHEEPAWRETGRKRVRIKLTARIS